MTCCNMHGLVQAMTWSHCKVIYTRGLNSMFLFMGTLKPSRVVSFAFLLSHFTLFKSRVLHVTCWPAIDCHEFVQKHRGADELCSIL